MRILTALILIFPAGFANAAGSSEDNLLTLKIGSEKMQNREACANVDGKVVFVNEVAYCQFSAIATNAKSSADQNSSRSNTSN